MDPAVLALTLAATVLAFVVSASAGLGGSLVLVPAYALVLGTKEGVALAALMLAGNNVAKVPRLSVAGAAAIPALSWIEPTRPWQGRGRRDVVGA
jgi:uncharacterized membrane protein YfcA